MVAAAVIALVVITKAGTATRKTRVATDSLLLYHQSGLDTPALKHARAFPFLTPEQLADYPLVRYTRCIYV